jgi:hypothetical protein
MTENEVVETLKALYEEVKSTNVDTIKAFTDKVLEVPFSPHTITLLSLAGANTAKNSGKEFDESMRAPAFWGFLAEWMSWHGKRMAFMDYDDMLIPDRKRLFTTINKEVFVDLQAKAKKLLEHPDAEKIDPEVKAHWQSVVDGKIPFGYFLAN